ncbi:uncharacterized protein PFL1_01809 [Pseudozyma flocculosa PF-1]|uniref:uncharacterized protein n=1 Tax=Pseudozyma flocculosa PF-1 TaxID=1277687 RepID=UPI0004561B3A|nr:uncharacterized protein PFL1_01809 [Pseudozyma flocculosa PF-1]EPQ30911.1 hypothetical protein PFL1_01809 [Pseudozyma flocculosa PF-1]
MPSSPTWIHQILPDHQRRRASSTASQNGAARAALPSAPPTTRPFAGRRSLLRQLLGKSTSKRSEPKAISLEAGATHAPVTHGDAHVICDASNLRGSLPQAQLEPSPHARDRDQSEAAAAARPRRPQTSDGIARPSKPQQPATPLRRQSGKQARLVWHDGPNGPELVQDSPPRKGSRAAPRASTSPRPAAAQTPVSGANTPDMATSSSEMRMSAESQSSISCSRRAHNPSAMTMPSPVPRPRQRSEHEVLERPALGLTERGSPRAPLDKAPVLPDSSDSRSDRVAESADGHWTTSMGSSAYSSQLHLDVDAASGAGGASFAESRSTVTGQPHLPFVPAPGPPAACRLLDDDAQTTEPNRHETPAAQLAPSSGFSEDQPQADSVEDKIAQSSGMVDGLGIAASPSPRSSTSHLASVPSPFATTARVTFGQNEHVDDSDVAASPASRPSSIISEATPRRISFAPSVRSRNRPAPKGIAPLLLRPDASASDSVAATPAERESTDRIAGPEARRPGRERRKRPSTAPAALDGDARTGAAFGRSYTSDDGTTTTDSDNDSEGEEPSFRTLRRLWVKARKASPSEEEAEELRCPNRSSGEESVGEGADESNPAAVAADEAESVAQADAIHDDDQEVADAAESAQRRDPELVFYPGTLILVRDGVSLDDTDGSITVDGEQSQSQAGKTSASAAEADAEAPRRRSGLFSPKLWAFRQRKADVDTEVVDSSQSSSPAAPVPPAPDVEAREANDMQGMPGIEAPPTDSDATIAEPSIEEQPPPLKLPPASPAAQHGAASLWPAERQPAPTVSPTSSLNPVSLTSPVSLPTRSPPSAMEAIHPSSSVPDQGAGQVLWHGSPPVRHAKLHTRALHLLRRAGRPRTATSHDATHATSRKALTDDGPMLRIVSKDGAPTPKSGGGILLPESLERPYYYPAPTRMDLDRNRRSAKSR